MKYKLGILIFGVTEILIGSITLIAVFLSILQGKSGKPLEVLIFVLITCSLSIGLGIGILRHNKTSFNLLIFFSLIIIFSKILIFANIIALNGELETSLPASLKNTISVLYHSMLVIYFTRKSIKEEFGERGNVILSLKIPFLK